MIVVVASVLGGLFVLGVVAAIAVPAFLSHRAKAQAQATSVSLPAEISGIPRMQDAKGAELEAQLAGSALPGQQVNGVYGQPGLPQVAVTITHASLSANDQRGFLAGAERGLTSRSTLTFADVDPGSLGGLMRCATGDFTVCAFADAGAAGFIMLLSPSIGDLDQARAAREAVEHRD